MQTSPNAAFKQCTRCAKPWGTRTDFLQDPQVVLVGYQVHFERLELGFFLFNHAACWTTMAIQATQFHDLYRGPVFEAHLARTSQCPEYCLHAHELRPCPAQCECAYVREIIQTILHWPKASISLLG